MLTSIRIQNFRSIRDAEVKLGQINLFIGPNNSGKSNFLKGVELILSSVHRYPFEKELSESDFSSFLFRNSNAIPLRRQVISFEVITDVLFGDENYTNTIQFKNKSENHQKPIYTANRIEVGPQRKSLEAYLKPNKCPIVYKPDPIKFLSATPISNEESINSDGSNLVSYLFNLSQNYKTRFRQLESDLARCVGNLVSISTPADPNEVGKLKLKLFDQNDIGYWAEEVSEGVLYFLALLCIVHQPDPPKLLLLEEPEKGIHPRRIKEVMDFIFELAHLRDIQIILTSHSPYVVDHFADISECISVFDRENGETVVRNAADIIEETNAKLNKPIRYSDALGEHWVSGFLGGVPA